MCSPLVPAVHFNTRYIETTRTWFGGGADLTPMYPDDNETRIFHQSFKKHVIDMIQAIILNSKKKHAMNIFLKHRNEPRGIGGIFYDYLNTGSFNNDFAFTKDIGIAMRIYTLLLLAVK